MTAAALQMVRSSRMPSTSASAVALSLAESKHALLVPVYDVPMAHLSPNDPCPALTPPARLTADGRHGFQDLDLDS